MTAANTEENELYRVP